LSKLEVSVSLRGRLLAFNNTDSFSKRVAVLSENILQLQQMLEDASSFFFGTPLPNPTNAIPPPTASPTDKSSTADLVEDPRKENYSEENLVEEGEMVKNGKKSPILLICGASLSFMTVVYLFARFAINTNRRGGFLDDPLQPGRNDNCSTTPDLRRNDCQKSDQSNNISTPSIASSAAVNGAPPEYDAHSLSYSTDNYSMLDFEHQSGFCSSDLSSAASGREFKDTNEILRDLDSLENRSETRSRYIQRTDINASPRYTGNMNNLQSGMELFNVSYESDTSSKSTNEAVNPLRRNHSKRRTSFPMQSRNFQSDEMITNTFSNVSTLSDTTDYISSELGVKDQEYKGQDEILLEIRAPPFTKLGISVNSSHYGLQVVDIKQDSQFGISLFRKGDTIVAVDEKDMRNMKGRDLAIWWHRSQQKEERIIKVLRKVPIEYNLDNEI
jgi:hypothetical protein